MSGVLEGGMNWKYKFVFETMILGVITEGMKVEKRRGLRTESGGALLFIGQGEDKQQAKEVEEE